MVSPSSSSSSSSSSSCSTSERKLRGFALSPEVQWSKAATNSAGGSLIKRSRTMKLSPPPQKPNTAAVPPSPLNLSPPRPILESSVVATTLPRFQQQPPPPPRAQPPPRRDLAAGGPSRFQSPPPPPPSRESDLKKGIINANSYPLKKRSSFASSSSPLPKKSSADMQKKPKKEVEEGVNDEEEIKVWNLRPRIPVEKKAEMNASASAEQHNSEKKRTKLSISLTKKEIEDDIFGLTGTKPQRRPRKRSKVLQKQLDALFPGLWLPNITADSYKVTEPSYKD